MRCSTIKSIILSGLFSAFCVLCGFGSCYASNGTESINITENWNTYSDQTGWHSNVSDGAVNIPYNLLNVDPNFVKTISYSRFRTGSLTVGDSNNTYNTITIHINISTGANGVAQWARDGNVPVNGYFEDSEGTVVNLSNGVGVQGSGCAYSANSSSISITCSATLSNYATLRQFNIAFGYSQTPVNTNQIYGYAINTPVRLTSITIDYRGTQDPNTALLETQNALLREQNNTINEINDYLQDDTPANVDSSILSGSGGWLPQGPVDAIITLPITIVQNLINSLNGSNCSPVVLPLPYVSEDLTIPCMRPVLQNMGYYTIYNVVGAIVGAFLLYKTLLWLYKYVDDTLTLQENNNTWFGGQ